jgi:hypothetical protein
MTSKANKARGKKRKYRPSYTKMRVRNSRLIIGMGACQRCHGPGTIYQDAEEPCGPCAGKGFISYARFDRICHKCKGRRTQTVLSREPVQCPRCRGVNSQRFEKGTRNDGVHPSIVARIPAKVYRLAFSLNDAEKKSLKVMSTLYDFGSSRKLHDSVLLRDERPLGASAHCISNPDGRLISHFGIFVTPDVRIIAPVYDDADVAWIKERNKQASRDARKRRQEAKKCCPTCRQKLKAAA